MSGSPPRGTIRWVRRISSERNPELIPRITEAEFEEAFRDSCLGKRGMKKISPAEYMKDVISRIVPISREMREAESKTVVVERDAAGEDIKEYTEEARQKLSELGLADKKKSAEWKTLYCSSG